MASQHHGHVVIETVDTVDPGERDALKERYQHDNSTSGVVVEDLENIHSSL